MAKKKLSILREAVIHSTEQVGNEDGSLETDKSNLLLPINWIKNSVILRKYRR